jgi:two-component system chemotaxis response regulator CheB
MLAAVSSLSNEVRPNKGAVPLGIKRVIAGFPATTPGVVIVQHMPAVFTLSLAGQLDRVCPLQVKEADDRRPLKAGEVLIAPGGRHLEMVKDEGGALSTRITDTAPVHSCRPSVDVLFKSMAECAGADALGIIMTGMGDDGAKGLKEMSEAGAHTIAQDEASCVVYGMPREAVAAGAVDEVLPLSRIGPQLLALLKAAGPLLSRV